MDNIASGLPTNDNRGTGTGRAGCSPGLETRLACLCTRAQIDAMAAALKLSANGDPGLLLRARVEMARHLARHPLPDADRRKVEAEVNAGLECGPKYEVF